MKYEVEFEYEIDYTDSYGESREIYTINATSPEKALASAYFKFWKMVEGSKCRVMRERVYIPRRLVLEQEPVKI